AFRWIENPKVRELFHFISLYIKLPNQRSLSNCILINTTNEVQTIIKDLTCKDKIGITIAFDGWRNVVNQELIGIVFITSLGETLIWGAEDIKTDDDNNGDENSFLEADWDIIIDRWKELLIKEEFEEEQDDFDEVDIDFLSLEIYLLKIKLQ
ncbi:37219_t:CDS:2, partial [Gigaspora margarita]